MVRVYIAQKQSEQGFDRPSGDSFFFFCRKRSKKTFYYFIVALHQQIPVPELARVFQLFTKWNQKFNLFLNGTTSYHNPITKTNKSLFASFSTEKEESNRRKAIEPPL